MRTMLLPLLFVATCVFAQTAPLNDTGQALCFDTTSNGRAECTDANTGDASTRPRQDGRFGRDALAGLGALAKVGAGVAAFDFTRICSSGEAAGSGACPAEPALGPDPTDWSCTRDNVTGLIWEVKTPGNAGDTFSFADASAIHATNANTSQLCGHDDWRVPSRRELVSLVDHGAESSPPIDMTFFPNTADSLFWSSDAYAPAPPGPATAWLVLFGNGYTQNSFQSSAHHVRVVRGGASFGSSASPLLTVAEPPGLVGNSDGTVTDPATGLMWDRCAWGQSWDGADDCTASAATQNWQAALEIAVTANDQSHRGYDDWRLPNRTELDSLVDINAFNPAIDTMAFPGTPPALFWSSTVFSPSPIVLAWALTFDNGSSRAVGQTSNYHVRLVRSGQSVDALSDPLFQDRFE